MEYIINFTDQGQFIETDDMILYLNKGDIVLHNSEEYIVINKCIDFTRNQFEVNVEYLEERKRVK